MTFLPAFVRNSGLGWGWAGEIEEAPPTPPVTPMDVFTRWSGLGWSWGDFEIVSAFDGIRQLEIAGGGTLKASWDSVVSALRYNVYVKPDSPTGLFSSTYLLGTFPNVISDVFFRTEADGVTLLQSTKQYYVGIRLVDAGGVEDSNSLYLCARPLGGEPVFVNDRHVAVVL